MGELGLMGVAIIIVFFIGFAILVVKCFRKAEQGKALVITGFRGTRVKFSGGMVIPVLDRLETVDISVKRIEIERTGKNGLICQDNIRADVRVAFFVRINKTVEDVLQVAESLGCDRASRLETLVELFDAKFSEALKTVGKQFDFTELYTSRERFKEEILQIIGRDLNGYRLEDCAIDYLEQTDLGNLNPDNILDAEGIKKITKLTADQKILANQIEQDRRKTIKKQNVEADEAVLEMERQLAETQEKQRREVASVKARETAETMKVQAEEKQRAEHARIIAEEEIRVAEENKDRQILVAQKNKERTLAIETERVEKERQLQVIERQRFTELATIEKERAVEEERKNIQDVIRERVIVEKAVVTEEEKIKDTKAIAEADRAKKVAVTNAERDAEEALIKRVKEAEALKQASELEAAKKMIEAEAALKASDKEAEARKVLAEALAAEEATMGMAEVHVMEARAKAKEMEGTAEANVLQKKAAAEAAGIEAKAEALRKQGNVEAEVLNKKGEAEAVVLEKTATAKARGEEAHAEAMRKTGEVEAEVLSKKGEAEVVVLSKRRDVEIRTLEEEGNARANVLEKEGFAKANALSKRFEAEAQGIKQKAEAMRTFDEDSRRHEEFRLQLEKDQVVEIKALQIDAEMAKAQAEVLREGLQNANIEIIGGDSAFFDQIAGAVARGKSIDRLVGGSRVLNDVKNTFFNGDPENFSNQVRQLINRFGVSSEDVKNLSIAALVGQLMSRTEDEQSKGMLSGLLKAAESMGISGKPLKSIL